jgi:nondiscriminating glutamyl-tRNA synthetase
MIRTRFAPSPTGYLHVGGLRTALFNYLFARKHGGAFILRIEDTDQQRKVENAVEQLIEMLHWAGIDYEEGPYKGGNFGPYIQSERLDIYAAHTRKLIDAGHAYYCFCSPERLERVRQDQIDQKQTPGYDRFCRNLDPVESESRIGKGERFVVRMKVPLEGEITFEDAVRGTVTIPYSVVDDQIIMKSDGFPTYHLAVVVDDHLMGVSHVIRGEEWLASTPKHILLYRFSGWDIPVHGHLPLLLNPDRSKLSKRQGHVSVEAYRELGYLPEALVNFVALLGWNPGDDRELFTLGELIQEFSIERVNKAGAVFDITKLNWMNAEYIKRCTTDELAKHLKPYFDKAGYTLTDNAKLHYVLDIVRTRITTLPEAVDEAAFIFRDSIDPQDDESRELIGLETSKLLFSELLKKITDAENISGEEFKNLVQAAGKELGIKGKQLFMPVRVALTGRSKGPDLPLLADVLGRDEIAKRLSKWV